MSELGQERKNIHTPKPVIISELLVRTRPGIRTQGQLLAGERVMRCALGRSGLGINKREGDGKTPVGRFRLLQCHLRTDRVQKPPPLISWAHINQDDGWCDAIGDRNYNRRVNLPYPESHETMHRDDHLYDIVFVMDHNITRRMGVGGSAIFFHLAHEDYRPTEGCVAINRDDMMWLMPRIGPQTVMVIK